MITLVFLLIIAGLFIQAACTPEGEERTARMKTAGASLLGLVAAWGIVQLLVLALLR